MPNASSVRVKGISCGAEHCVLWDADGVLYAWGDGGDGRLGLPSKGGNYNYVVTDPHRVDALRDVRVIEAACGFRHTIALTYRGEIYSWGRQHYDKHTSTAVHSQNDATNVSSTKPAASDFVRPKKL
jgi:alpha-tubulin suppressor-like RCC1 family protein